MRAGVIGIGQAGWGFDLDEKRPKPASHAGAYLSSDCDGVELAAVADPDRARLNSFTEAHPEVHAYTDYELMLSREKLDMVSVATPPETHCRIVRNTCRYEPVRGILCEKPIAPSLEDARSMVKTCRSFRVTLAVNHTRRYDPRYRAVKTYIEGGGIGRLKSALGLCSGEVMDGGIHLFDLFNYYSAPRWTYFPVATLATPCPYLVFEIHLFGEKGAVRIAENGREIRFLIPAPSPIQGEFLELGPVPPSDRPCSMSEGTPIMEAVLDLKTCIETGSSPLSSGEDGVRAVEMALDWI